MLGLPWGPCRERSSDMVSVPWVWLLSKDAELQLGPVLVGSSGPPHLHLWQEACGCPVGGSVGHPQGSLSRIKFNSACAKLHHLAILEMSLSIWWCPGKHHPSQILPVRWSLDVGFYNTFPVQCLNPDTLNGSVASRFDQFILLHVFLETGEVEYVFLFLRETISNMTWNILALEKYSKA